jgi:hypothetical protein
MAETPQSESYVVHQRPKDSVNSTMATCLYVLLMVILIAVIIVFSVWLYILSKTNSGKDIDARDISARDIHVTSNAFVGCDLCVSKDLKTLNSKVLGRTMTVPMRSSDLAVTLTKLTSAVILTSPSATNVNVTLTQASNTIEGMWLTIVNQSGSASFTVTPAAQDAVNGSLSPLVVNGKSALFYMAGLNGTINAYDWVYVA